MRRAAFSLIELAIVLVIIGLLVGGVLVGRDLIQAAKTQNFIAMIERLDAGVATFHVKYRTVPGDLRPQEATLYGFAPRTGALGQGDGNGIVEGCARGASQLGCETALFWRDLWEAHVSALPFTLTTNIPVDGTAAGFNIKDYLPEPRLRIDTSLYHYGGMESRNGHYVANIPAVAADGTLSTAAALTPLEARNIDDKIDDAAPDNGTVRAMSSLLSYDTGAVPTHGVCVNNTLAQPAYNVLPDYAQDIACQIFIRGQL